MAGKNRKENIQIQHPLKQLKRLMSYVFRDYGIHCIAVLILIVVSVLANVQGTMFTRTLIDEYIQPLLLSDRPDFAPLLHAIIRTVSFRFTLSTTWATGVPEEMKSPTWTLTAVTEPEA